MLPSEFGQWFHAIREGTMKQTSLDVFYHLGSSLRQLRTPSPVLGLDHSICAGMDMGAWNITTCFAVEWLKRFIEETKDVPLPDSRTSARKLLDMLASITTPYNPERILTGQEAVAVFDLYEQFERDFDREQRNIDVFTVMPKGIYNTRQLIEEPENKFPENLRKHFPSQFIYDLKQAGKCLAFELPTACAFHVCRATESLMLKYYEVLKGQQWSFQRRDWNIYIEQLASGKQGADKVAPKHITSRLNEIRDMDRNSYIHPDINVTLEEAPILFELCTNVIFQMAQEIQKKYA
jgi:hypothetical protein